MGSWLNLSLSTSITVEEMVDENSFHKIWGVVAHFDEHIDQRDHTAHILHDFKTENEAIYCLDNLMSDM